MELETIKESLREDIKYHSRAASNWLHFFNEMQRTKFAQKMCEQHAMVRMGLEVELQALIDKEN